MSKLQSVIRELHRLDNMSSRDIWINRIHPVAKLLVTFSYLVILMSVKPDQIMILFSMSVYLVIILITADISLIRIIKRLIIIFIAITFFSALNTVFDRNLYVQIYGINITTGMIASVTLALKGYFSLIAVSILSETTSMNDICYAMNCLFIPKIIITMISLINRYVMMLLQETNRTMNAYSLRATSDKGINKNAWGTLLGNMIIRSIDRAERVYESMLLRGFNGSFYYETKSSNRWESYAFAVIFITSFLLFRFIPVFRIVGELVCNL